MAASLGSLSVTQEASGEIRVKVKLPGRALKGNNADAALQAKRAGCAQLVYSEDFGEMTTAPAGFGSLPRDSDCSAYGRRQVKNCAGALKRIYNKRIVFGTLTLAGSTQSARRALATWSGKVVELLNKWRTYHAPDSLWVYKWEWQKNGALHLHFAIGDHYVCNLRALEQQFQEYVYRLHNKLSQLSGVDCFEREHGGTWRGFPDVIRSRIEPVRKCVKRYLAKYMAKKVGVVTGSAPSAWWGRSERLAQAALSFRRCTSLHSEHWERLVSTALQVKRALSGAVPCLYTYRSLFAPHNVTHIIYPEEDGDIDVYACIVMLLEHAADDMPPLPHNCRAISGGMLAAELRQQVILAAH